MQKLKGLSYIKKNFGICVFAVQIFLFLTLAIMKRFALYLEWLHHNTTQELKESRFAIYIKVASSFEQMQL